MRFLKFIAVPLAAASVLAVASAGAAHADFGPYTCLNGYVWGGATSTDYVCVTWTSAPGRRSTTSRTRRASATSSPTSRAIPRAWPATCCARRSPATSSGDAADPGAGGRGQRGHGRPSGLHPDPPGRVARQRRAPARRPPQRRPRDDPPDDLIHHKRIAWQWPARSAGVKPGGRIDVRLPAPGCPGAHGTGYVRVSDPSSRRWAARRAVPLCVRIDRRADRATPWTPPTKRPPASVVVPRSPAASSPAGDLESDIPPNPGNYADSRVWLIRWHRQRYGRFRPRVSQPRCHGERPVALGDARRAADRAHGFD